TVISAALLFTIERETTKEQLGAATTDVATVQIR
ncbi:unnamed protein product, partial [marine sediment metagenome]